MSLDDVAKITKIQARTLERLEAGKLDGLPAEVFVRGFVRSFARCVGLDEDEALRRYAACGLGNGTADLTPTVRALVEAMVDLAPGSQRTAAPRATPRRITAVMPPVEASADELPPAPAMLTGPGPSTTRENDGTVVAMMMLPETGTVVLPAHFGSAAESMSDCEPMASTSMAMAVVAPEPVVAEPVVEAAPVEAPVVEAAPVLEAVAVEAAPVVGAVAAEPDAKLGGPVAVESSKKKKSRRGKRNKRAETRSDAGMPRTLLATGTPFEALSVVAAPAEPVEAAPIVEAAPVIEPIAVELTAAEPTAVIDEPGFAGRGSAAEWQRGVVDDEPVVTAPWSPKMPPIATTPSVPWRRPATVGAPGPVVPTLVIDDSDPDSAERVLEERAEKHAPRRSFLPPILLDREDRSARQGGLTLAVIILLIAATLTLSYLMRRPSAGGDGMTQIETPATLIG